MTIYPLSRWPVLRVSFAVTPPMYALFGATVVMSAGALIPAAAPRAVVVLPLALLVPGYAVVLALYGRRPPLDALPLLALSVLLSMACYPLLALVLNGLAVPLKTGSVLIAADLLVLALTVAAMVRISPASRTPIATSQASIAEDGLLSAPRSERTPRGRLWALGMAALLVVAGVGASEATHVFRASDSTVASYTAFYLSGRWARTHSIVQVAPRHRLSVAVGIVNHSGHRERYRLSPLLDGTPWRWSMITLPAEGRWTGTVSGLIPAGQCLHRLDITLHAGGSRLPMKPLILWVQAGKSLPRSCLKGKGA